VELATILTPQAAMKGAMMLLNKASSLPVHWYITDTWSPEAAPPQSIVPDAVGAGVGGTIVAVGPAAVVAVAAAVGAVVGAIVGAVVGAVVGAMVGAVVGCGA